MGVKPIETKNEFDEVLKSSGQLIVVDFYAAWCGPCKVIGPKIVEMSEEFSDVLFYKVDVDDNTETAESEEISAMPTIKFYKNGKQVDEFVGANEKEIRDKIEAHK